MKFKSNTPVSAHDIESIEIAFESLDFTEMEQAQELLEDLTVLNQNIEKFGITEPVMHLVGGTLEAMDINIASKEACLEGLGDKIKEGAKKVWEMIIKIYERIRDYIKGLIGKFNKEKFNELKDKFKGQKVDTNEIDATNLIPAKYIKTIIDLANDAERNVDHDAESWARAYPELLTLGDGGNIQVNEKFDSETRDPKFSAKGYSDLSKMYEVSGQLVDSMSKIEKAVEFCIKQSGIYLKQLQTGNGQATANERFSKGYKATAEALSKLVPYCLRSSSVATSIGNQAEKSGTKQQ